MFLLERIKRHHFSLCTLTAMIPWLAFANVIIHGTRVIYPQDQQEVSIQLSNDGDQPALVQAWLDIGDPDEKISNISVPFVLMPPVFRIEPHAGQTLRLTSTGIAQPQDRESIYWLNVLDIPPKDLNLKGENVLKMAIRSRIKIFFRPPGLDMAGARNSYARLIWGYPESTSPKIMPVKNPTPYFINIASVTLENRDRKIKSLNGEMIPPFSTGEIAFNSILDRPDYSKLTYEVVNDFGTIIVLKNQNASM